MKSVVFYSSATCGNCRMMFPWVKALVPDVLYRQLDGTEPIVTTRNIMAMPTIMVMDGEDEIARLGGGNSQARVKQFLDTYYFN